MHIFVTTLTGQTITLSSEASNIKIPEKVGNHPDLLRFMLAGKQLHNGCALFDYYNIQKGSTLHVALCLDGSSSADSMDDDAKRKCGIGGIEDDNEGGLQKADLAMKAPFLKGIKRKIEIDNKAIKRKNEAAKAD